VSDWITVSSAAELVDAARTDSARIEVSGTLSGMPSVRLAPGVQVRGGVLQFGAKGLRMTRDNVLEGVRVETAEHEPAILNDLDQPALGTLTLREVSTVGQVMLLADGAVASGRVVVEGLRVERADVRGRTSRPAGFGVEAMQGGFTLWNRQPDARVVITASLCDVSAGTAAAPIRGSGIFVAGHGRDGGRVEIDVLRTGEVHADGGIATGTPDLISGGVFVVSGAIVGEVINAGPVTTYGANDMVLDNWGRAASWSALAPVTSQGPSAIGFVNFGEIDELSVRAPIETHGAGARGFNLYDGALSRASFESIRTAGDGAVGIQVDRELPVLEIAGDLVTTGGEGTSLVKGVQTRLQAIALSIQGDGHIGRVTIGGRLATHGDGVVTVDVEGSLDELSVGGGIAALGHGSDAVRAAGEIPGLDAIAVEVRDGRAVVDRPS
jgi:hypothetical protein